MAIDFEAVRRDYPLEQVVSKSLRLVKSGANKVAVCPFHADKNPSLVLFKDQTYHCFGCGAHGDVIDFVAQTRGISISEAVRDITGGVAPVMDEEDRKRRAKEVAHREAMQRKREENATLDARARWTRALPVNGGGNPYLERKGVAPYGTRCEGDNLLVPIYGLDGLILSVQSIAPNGAKLFHAGAPVRDGTMTLGNAPDGPVVIVEGFATGATIQAATGHVVVVGFSKGALLRTAQIAAKRFAGREIIVAADSNGVDAAQAAAEAVGGRVVEPDLQGAEGSDFNDQAAHYGLEDVAAAFDILPMGPTETALPLVWYADIQPVLNGNWIIKKVIPADAFVTIIGHPGCGKSFFALDLSAHIAAGIDWQGRKTRRGLVIYLAAEGQRGQLNRVTAWRQHYGEDDLAFAMIPVGINLRDAQADLPALMETIEAAIKRSGLDLAVLVVDTLNRTFGGGDENGSDMSEYVDNVGRLKARFGCTAIVVHHIPKNSDGSVTERGHGSLRGAVETSLVVSYDQDSGLRTIKCTKMKDGEDGWSIDFKLKSIELGTDEDGEPVTSCVVVEPDGNEPPSRVKGPSLSPTQRGAYNELLATLEASPRGVPRDIPDGMIDPYRVSKVALRADWRDRWMAIHGVDMAVESASATFRRAVTELTNKGLVAGWNDHVWATHK